MQTITVNNHTFDFDIMDVATAERYENAMQAVLDQVTAIEARKNLKNSESMRAQCEIVRNMVDTVLGDGAADTLLPPDKLNLRDAFGVFQAIFDAVEAQSQEAATGFRRTAAAIKSRKASNKASNKVSNNTFNNASNIASNMA